MGEAGLLSHSTITVIVGTREILFLFITDIYAFIWQSAKASSIRTCPLWKPTPPFLLKPQRHCQTLSASVSFKCGGNLKRHLWSNQNRNPSIFLPFTHFLSRLAYTELGSCLYDKGPFLGHCSKISNSLFFYRNASSCTHISLLYVIIRSFNYMMKVYPNRFGKILKWLLLSTQFNCVGRTRPNRCRRQAATQETLRAVDGHALPEREGRGAWLVDVLSHGAELRIFHWALTSWCCCWENQRDHAQEAASCPR